jgi:hypothetical protein
MSKKVYVVSTASTASFNTYWIAKPIHGSSATVKVAYVFTSPGAYLDYLKNKRVKLR